MTTVTQPPHYTEPTATVPLANLAALVLDQALRERDRLLAIVDDRERMLIKMGRISGPRTAELRRRWKEQGR